MMIRHVFRTGAALASLALIAAVAAPAGAATSSSAPTITITLSPTTIDYLHQNIAVSGTVSTVPAGTAVTLAYMDGEGYIDRIVTATAADGSYQATITNPDLSGGAVTATAATSSASASAYYNVASDLLTVTASFAQSYVSSDASDVLTGVATVSYGSTSEPLADTWLNITTPGNAYSSPSGAAVETASDGRFSYAAPGSPGGSLSYTIAPAEIYLNGQLTVSFAINSPAQITSFSGALSAEHMLEFDACGGTDPGLPDGPLTGSLYYQYAARPGGPWKTIGAGSEIRYGSCFAVAYGANYPGQFRAPLAAGYYRAYAPAVTGQMSAVSNVIYLRRYPTKITGFMITPRRANRDGRVTVSGRLWQLRGKWIPDARQRITIEYRYNHKTYVLRHQLTTSPAGRFSGAFRVPGTASWLAIYGGESNQFAVTTKPVNVTVG